MKFLRRLRPMWEYLTFYIYLCITDTTGEIFYREKEERGKKDTRSNSPKEKKDYYFCIIILLKKLIKINNLITQQVFYLSHSGDHFSSLLIMNGSPVSSDLERGQNREGDWVLSPTAAGEWEMFCEDVPCQSLHPSSRGNRSLKVFWNIFETKSCLLTWHTWQMSQSSILRRVSVVFSDFLKDSFIDIELEIFFIHLLFIRIISVNRRRPRTAATLFLIYLEDVLLLCPILLNVFRWFLFGFIVKNPSLLTSLKLSIFLLVDVFKFFSFFLLKIFFSSVISFLPDLSTISLDLSDRRSSWSSSLLLWSKSPVVSWQSSLLGDAGVSWSQNLSFIITSWRWSSVLSVRSIRLSSW